jgi:hypothetical protein
MIDSSDQQFSLLGSLHLEALGWSDIRATSDRILYLEGTDPRGIVHREAIWRHQSVLRILVGWQFDTLFYGWQPYPSIRVSMFPSFVSSEPIIVGNFFS